MTDSTNSLSPDLQFDLILGRHSIIEALKNPKRSEGILLGTVEALRPLKTRPFSSKIELRSFSQKNDFQAHVDRLLAARKETSARAPGNMALLCSKRESIDPSMALQILEKGSAKKIIALDGLTDERNIGAIIRTAAFFGVDWVISSVKGGFEEKVSLAKMASGGLEHVDLINCASLGRFIKRANELGVFTIALDENAPNSIAKEFAVNEDEQQLNPNTGTSVLLILGAEDRGISNAVRRVAGNSFALAAVGKINSLNVSVAAALAMQIVFSNFVKSACRKFSP